MMVVVSSQVKLMFAEVAVSVVVVEVIAVVVAVVVVVVEIVVVVAVVALLGHSVILQAGSRRKSSSSPCLYWT